MDKMCKIRRIDATRRSNYLLLPLLMLSLAACSTTTDDIFDLSTRPALQTDGAHVGRGGIDTSRVNQGPSASSAVTFVGVIKNKSSTMSISAQDLNDDMADIRLVGGKVNHDETVEISFEEATLTYVVKQLLGGLLSANYIMPDETVGTVTFKTEGPVPRSAIPAILRDMLARNGYVMKVINGVYQIGDAATILALELNAGAGAGSEYTSRVIDLKQGNLDEIVAAVAQILPAGASVTPVPSSNSLILRVSPADERSVMDLLGALVASSSGDDLVAVVPLREGAPESVAATMNTYFATSNSSSGEIPLIVALEQQQALMIVASSQRVMDNARTMLRSLDTDNRDAASLRIIALKNLPAQEISDQLNAIFGAGASKDTSGGAAPANDRNQAAADSSSDNGVEGGESVQAPATIRRSPDTKTSRIPAQQAAADAVPSAAGNTALDTEEPISIAPDERNNALLVHSTYKQFKRIRDVVEALDVPLAQVVIEATIVEVSLNNKLKYGVQAFLSSHGVDLRSSQTSAIGDGGEAGGVAAFRLNTVGGTSVAVVLEALQTVTKFKVISSPYLTVLDGKTARLSVGDQIPFLTQQTNASETGTTTTTNAIEIRDVGIILEVTPNIRADNSVILNVQQEVSSTKTTGAGETLTPVISQRAINSDVVVQSGKTVLLGGLIQDRSDKVVSGVPGLSTMPVVGGLFRQTDQVKERTELLVMITPRVIRSAFQLDHLTRLLKSRTLGARN